jgi:hypothetical protein
MAPSADWTASEADNNTTFFLTNFLPQAPNMNQGPWARLEDALRDSVLLANREVYIIAGGIFTNGVGLGSIQNRGLIWIPDSTYKIALIMPAGTGIGAAGTLPANTTVLAVNMPNVNTISGDWRTWLTTVARVQASTGYDFLDLLSEPTECLVEGRNCAPTARITAPAYTASEGQSIEFSGATSSDPNQGDALVKQWFVNGVPAGTGETFSYTFDNDGLYTIKLVVTDGAGANSTAVATASIANVAPVMAAFSGATILRGETYTAAGTFADPGADTWTGSVVYGDGASSPLSMSGRTFSLSHVYATAGSFTVTVTVNDGASSDTRTATVAVKTSLDGIADLDAAVSGLGLNGGLTNSLRVKLTNAAKQVAAGKTTPAVNMLEAFIEEVGALAQSGRIGAADAQEVVAYAQRVIRSL